MRALAWFLALCAVALATIPAFTYPAWLLLHPHFDFPFHRIGERIAMLALLIGFVLVARRLGLADRASLGYGAPRRQFLREMALALAIGVTTMLAVVALMTALGLLDWSPAAALSASRLAKVIGQGLLSGIAVAFIEETFLRGAMLTAVQRESGSTTAIVSTAILYSATHFIGKFHIAADQVTPHSGVDLLAGFLQTFSHPLAIADAFLCLFAVGAVLAAVRVATGNIAACLGLHAGWVWVILVAHEMSHPQESSPLRFLLSRFDGFIGWLVLAWTAVLGWVLWRFYKRRAGQMPAPTVP